MQCRGGLNSMLTQESVREIFLEAGALQKGHFLLSSGRHSEEYWEKFWVLQYPNHVETLCAEIARRFRNDNIEVVLGPTTGGILLALEVGRQMGVKALYAEKEDGVRMLRRGLQLPIGTRTLIVDDILTTGGAVKECVDLAESHEATIVGAAVILDRSGGKVDLGYRLESLLSVQGVSFSTEECPLCKQGVPLKKPGSSVQK